MDIHYPLNTQFDCDATYMQKMHFLLAILEIAMPFSTGGVSMATRPEVDIICPRTMLKILQPNVIALHSLPKKGRPYAT
jgi:hypothetical protein